MVAKIFVLWGWNFLGKKVSGAIEEEMSAEYKNQELSSRLAMVAADTIFKRKLSRSVIACLGIMVECLNIIIIVHNLIFSFGKKVNRPLRRLSKQLVAVLEQKAEVTFE